MIYLDKANPRGIIWIASYPRSGNTWTRAFINALVNLIRNPSFTGIDINRIEEFSASESAAAQYEKFLGRPPIEADTAAVAAARPKVQEEIVRTTNRPVFIKTHNARLAEHNVPIINMAVSSGAIYVVRNPLDVAISFAHLRDIGIDQAISDMATKAFGRRTDRENVRVITGTWSEHVASWAGQPHQAVLVVRYEDMVEKPSTTFAAIAAHLLMRPSEEQLARAIEMSGFATLRTKEEAAGFKEKPETSKDLFFREGRSGQWRERLTKAQVARVVADHGPVMQRFGYLPSDKGNGT